MNDKDKEAFEKWFLSLDNSYLNRVIKLNRGASYEVWQVACEYIRNKSNPLDALSLYEKLERERDENKKLREALEKAYEDFTKQGFHKQASRVLLALNITTGIEALKEVEDK
jgi:hypothetical protein